LPVNRFFLTQAGWISEDPLRDDGGLWRDLVASDVRDRSWDLEDETTVSPPLAGLACTDSPPAHAGATAKLGSAVASYGLLVLGLSCPRAGLS
jgi:hypothetical protein